MERYTIDMTKSELDELTDEEKRAIYNDCVKHIEAANGDFNGGNNCGLRKASKS